MKDFFCKLNQISFSIIHRRNHFQSKNSLQVTVYDKDFLKNDRIGSVEIDLFEKGLF
jgi:hypothetical protein